MGSGNVHAHSSVRTPALVATAVFILASQSPLPSGVTQGYSLASQNPWGHSAWGKSSRGLGLPFTLHRGQASDSEKAPSPCPSRQPLPGGTLSMAWTSGPHGSGASLWSRFEKKCPRKLKTDLSRPSWSLSGHGCP